jgi:hypothetical protein
MHRLSHLVADPSDPYYNVHFDKRLAQFAAAVEFAVILVLVAVIVLQAQRPHDIIIKDRLFADAPVVTRAEHNPDRTAADARVFFINMLKLRHGWDSMTLLRDLDTFKSQCVADQREFEQRFLDEPIAPNPEEPKRTIPRVQH